MRKSKAFKPVFKATRNPSPQAARDRKWACVDTRDNTVVGTFKFRANAVSCAGLANSVNEQYGSTT
jgi:hypothetical protein